MLSYGFLYILEIHKILKCPLILYIHMFQYSEIFFFFFSILGFFFFFFNKLAGQWLSCVSRWFFWLHLLFSPRESLVAIHFFEKKKKVYLGQSTHASCLLRTLQCLLNIFLFEFPYKKKKKFKRFSFHDLSQSYFFLYL